MLNCVGLLNYKAFLLFLAYTFAASGLAAGLLAGTFVGIIRGLEAGTQDPARCPAQSARSLKSSRRCLISESWRAAPHYLLCQWIKCVTSCCETVSVETARVHLFNEHGKSVLMCWRQQACRTPPGVFSTRPNDVLTTLWAFP